MVLSDRIVRVPWDSKVFCMDVFEIKKVSVEVLTEVTKIPGHFTVRVDPLFPKGLLHDFGFYYCDTLIEPYCTREWFHSFEHDKITISRDVPFEELAAISLGAFSHGRFHRDFNIDHGLADRRYQNWLRELYDAGKCYGLLFEGKVAGFICFYEQRILLHALGENFRGKRLSKYFWSNAFKTFFDQRCNELVSSVSASNMPVLNLYASLGFKFRNPRDIYHRLTL